MIIIKTRTEIFHKDMESDRIDPSPYDKTGLCRATVVCGPSCVREFILRPVLIGILKLAKHILLLLLFFPVKTRDN
jgi:hypothetical protein